nr:hypothetical protein [uncultured Rhodopila sp.]
MDSTTQTAGLIGYYPEMGEARPETKIEARLAHYGKHYFLTSSVQLSGRGVEFLKTIKPGDMTNSRRDGWHEYKVTLKAFDAICKAHAVACEILL